MEFFGLLGEKLGHSLSPMIHKVILNDIKRDGAYKLFPIPKENLGDFVNATKLLDIRGFNVTIPYKQDIMKYLDCISEEAKTIGAVNTVMMKSGKLYGYNTDYFGFGATFEVRGINLKDKIAVILGAGGACKAALAYLLDHGVKEAYIVSRNPNNISLDVDCSKVKVVDYNKLKEIKGDVLINSTPVGMYPNIGNSPVGEDIIENFEILMDLVYNPMTTRFLEIGNNLGKTTLGGLYMLVGQAVKAQEIFQGMHIEEEIIHSIYEHIKEEIK